MLVIGVPFKQPRWKLSGLAEVQARDARFVTKLLTRVRNIEDAGIGQRRVKFRLADDRLVAETLFEHFERRTFVQAVRGTEEDAIVRAVGEAQRQLEALRDIFRRHETPE